MSNGRAEVPTFYSDGVRRMELGIDTGQVAVDPRRAKSCLEPARMEEIENACKDVLLFGLLLVERAHLTISEIDTLDDVAAILPVYSGTGSKIVVLPEVLVSAQESLHQNILSTVSQQTEVTSRNKTRLVLRMTSGRSADAMHLASSLSELEGVTASPNLLRLT